MRMEPKQFSMDQESLKKGNKEMDFDSIMEQIASEFGVPILGEGKLPTKTNSENLRRLQQFIGKVVSAHDKLSDEIAPERRLVGKRGRVAGSNNRPQTAADVLSALK